MSVLSPALRRWPVSLEGSLTPSLRKGREPCVLTAQVITCPVSLAQLADSLALSRTGNGSVSLLCR